MSWLVDFINSFFSSLWDIFKLGFDAFVSVIFTVLFWFWDGFLFVVTNLISTLDLTSLAFTEYAHWADLPPQLIYLINQLALPQCAGIIGAAIFIRMILNIIPAALTRV